MSHAQSNDTHGRIEAKPDYASPFLQDQHGDRFAMLIGRTFDDARRLAACWNACEGVKTEILEQAGTRNDWCDLMQGLEQERDQAIELLRDVLKESDAVVEAIRNSGGFIDESFVVGRIRHLLEGK